MSKQWSAGAAALALTLTTLTACNSDGSGSGIPAGVNTINSYTAIPLVSSRDEIAAPRRDENLQDPRGIVFAGGKAWIANAGSNTVTVYDALGIAQPTIVRIPAGNNGEARPAGIVYNGNGTDFRVNSPGASGSAQVIVATGAGTLAAWAPGSTTLQQSGAVTVYDDGAGRAQYTGLALLDVNGTRFLYAADFRNGKIDTFDSNFNRVATIGGFLDTSLPSGYAPFGIHAIGNRLIVTYARKGATAGGEPVTGAGNGYVNEFDGSGRFERRIASGDKLNAPWGVAVAPSDFGQHSRKLLIANHGDGQIHAYDPERGSFTGTLNNTSGEVLTVPGIWSISLAYTLGTTPGDGGTDGGSGSGTGGSGTGNGGTGNGGTGTGGTGTGGTGTGAGTGAGGSGSGSGTGTGTGTGGNGIDLGGFSPVSLYYTAGGSNEADGSFGRIDVAQPDTDASNGSDGNGGSDGAGSGGTGTGTDGTGTGGNGTGGTGTGGTGAGGTGSNTGTNTGANGGVNNFNGLTFGGGAGGTGTGTGGSGNTGTRSGTGTTGTTGGNGGTGSIPASTL